MKIFTLVSLLSVSALTVMPVVASADPVVFNIKVTCPISGTSAPNDLSNFGDVIAGYGKEELEDNNYNVIYFKSTAPLNPNTPHKLDNYRNESIDYDSATGTVSCNYISAMQSEPRLSVSYVLTNGKGGRVAERTGSYVNILLPLGVHK